MKGETAILQFKKLTTKGFAPVRSSEKAAGFDLKRYSLKLLLAPILQ